QLGADEALSGSSGERERDDLAVTQANQHQLTWAAQQRELRVDTLELEPCCPPDCDRLLLRAADGVVEIQRRRPQHGEVRAAESDSARWVGVVGGNEPNTGAVLREHDDGAGGLEGQPPAADGPERIEAGPALHSPGAL